MTPWLAGYLIVLPSVYGSVGPDPFGYFASLLVDRVGIPVGAEVLDVATGAGAVLRAVAR